MDCTKNRKNILGILSICTSKMWDKIAQKNEREEQSIWL